jgi:hypothetical protein
MNSFAISNFISNLAKLNYFDEEIIKKIADQAKQGKINVNPVSVSYILWALAKFKIYN